jgi:hypothetical protein
MRLILIPSRSGEELFSKFFTNVIIWFGWEGKNSRLGIFGGVLINDIGSVGEGGID